MDASTDSMKALPLQREEQQAFATAALALRYGERGEGEPPAPVTAEQLIEARRPEDFGNSLWTTFQRVQENALRGGQPGSRCQGPTPAHPPGGQHRPQREPEPRAVGAGRRDAQAQGLIHKD